MLWVQACRLGLMNAHVLGKPRGELYLATAGLLWLMWLFGTLSQSAVRTLSVFLFDLLGATIMIVLSRRLPLALRITVIGLGLSLISIAVGDGNLSAALLTNVDRLAWILWRNPFYYFGSLLVTIFASILPFALFRQGMYVKTKPLFVLVISLAIAAILTLALAVLSSTSLTQLIFFFVVCYVTAMFAAQHFVLRDDVLAPMIRQLAMVFVLASLGRIIAVLLNDSPTSGVIYDLFWCAGISAACWTLIARE